jgi:hypothetical protein
MPWVRIDEHAMDHPKITSLSDGAFRLWVQGLAYCQKHLTDGFVLEACARALAAYSQKRRAALESAGLWDRTEHGIAVHDYLQWNDSRQTVLGKRESARDRMRAARERSQEVRANTEQCSPERSRAVLRGVVCSGETQTQEAKRERGPGETKKPARLSFGGKVLEVPKFLDDEFVKRLNGIAFDLTAFYIALDTRLAQTGEPWDIRWIRDQFAAETPAPERRRVELEQIERPFTAEERRRAENHRRSVWGGCRHDPRCDTAVGCIALIIRTWRERECAAS